ncbi:MAG TPA: NifB/NifX family molybdenum-iron cluster-binding protein [Bacteroidales bacterium]|nr:NifB/NifX family molybdenum-iron cluster-binding protein [Bacteroidales bacterium]HPS17777.1 NifB/NifX family molybdenum-iron cluster-binding protein [Bacteroidales bacterium]
MKKVAVPTREGQVDDHFGHCEYYTIFTIEDGKVSNEETFKAPEGCGCKSNVASVLASMGIKIMLAGNMGMGALNVLNMSGIEVYRGCSGNVKEVITEYLKGEVTDSGEGCHSHEGCDNH